MRAMILPALGSLEDNPNPLVPADLPVPEPAAANEALRELKARRIRGAKVLRVSGT